MNLEEENKFKRKNEPLSDSEWLTFFLFPFKKRHAFELENTDTFNRVEEDRFKKFGFEKKIKQSSIARTYGYLFYFGITLIIIVLIY